MNKQQASQIIELIRGLDHPLQKIMDFAQTLGEELNLPDEAVIAVATTILEQINGIAMEDSEEKPSSSSNSGMGATYIDQKDHVPSQTTNH